MHFYIVIFIIALPQLKKQYGLPYYGVCFHSLGPTHMCINQLEAVQRSAARMCYKDFSGFSSISTMLTDLDLPTLTS